MFVIAALLAAGATPARGRTAVRREDYDVRRLVIVALALLAAGAIGVAYKAHLLGGVPLLSGNADALRARAFGPNGNADIPAWSSALTNCLYLSMWTALVAAWAAPRDGPRWRIAALVALAAIGLFGASLEASRNITLFALAIPVIAAYLIAQRRRRRARLAQLGVGAAIVLALISGVFVARLAQANSVAHDYITREMNRQPVAVRPLIPLYVNGVFPLEAARRVHEHFPQELPYGLGGYSLLSLPDAFFPEGKLLYGQTVGALMARSSGPASRPSLYWTVASYQGRALADLGPLGVIMVSLLLGLAFGRLYRWARLRNGFLAVAMLGYVAYYSAFMVYDNLLSFTIIPVFDLFVILVLAWLVRRPDSRTRLAQPVLGEARG